MVFKELRFALRSLGKAPTFTVVVVSTLALAIGVNTIIFSMASFLLLRPLPFQDPDTLGLVFGVDGQQGTDRGGISFPDFADWRDATTAFEQLAATKDATHTLTGVSEPRRVSAFEVSFNLFEVWGLTPLLGRTFTASEDRPGGESVVMLSHGFWTRQFGAAPDIVGSQLELDGEAHTVVGVLGSEVEIGGFSLIDVWTPLALDVTQSDRGARTLRVTGRLAPGVTLEEAGAEIQALSQRLQTEYPATNAQWNARVVSLWVGMTGENAWMVLTLLGVVVAFVLLIACANVANLMLARGVARRTVLALRVALGAGRLRLIRELLIESVVLGVLGGAVGLGVAYVGLAVIHAIPSEPFFQQIVIDERVLLFTALLSLMTPLIFGLGPAVHASRTNVNEVLKEGSGRAAGGRRGRRSRGVLVVAQVSLAVTLLAVAGLALRTAVALQAADRGFDTHEVLTVPVDLAVRTYSHDAAVLSWYDALFERLVAIPGVEAAAAASTVAVFGRGISTTMTIEGRPVSSDYERPQVAHVTVSPDYHRVMGISVLQGRALRATDGPDSTPVALVNQEMARRYWSSDRRALGQRVKLGALESPSPWLEIVGVVGNAEVDPTSSPQPQVYVPLAQDPQRSMGVVVRSNVDPTTLAPAVRETVRRADPDQVVSGLQSVQQVLRDQLASDRLLIGMFGSFALLALLLSASGLYGVMSYSVSQRSQEIGIRVALGAAPGHVLGLIVLAGVKLAALGVVVGIGGGLLLGSAISSILFGVGATDPLTYVAVLLMMSAVAALASYIPARRAMRVDPVTALRLD